MSGPEKSRQENKLLIGIFVLALLYSLYGVTLNWTVPFMSGHEFRQAHTAIVAYYIDQQDNFSLLYETPIFGKPWISLLLEVPIYEWSVVGLSRATGLPHVVAARTISATCFYLMLPAIYLLLGRLAVPKPRRLLLLALVLSTPVYIYYSRAFLMDSMALMCSAWWLLAFVRTMDERRWSWLTLAIVAGTGAALVKSAILAVWMIPGAAYGAWMLWRDLWARPGGWVTPLKTTLWGAATVVVALGTLRAWVAYTDPFKAAHASAWIFTSKNLSVGNWGLFDFKALFSAHLWRYLLACWEQAIMSRWLIGLGLVAGLSLPAVRWRVLGTGGLFFLAQFLFPYAYAYQDYYFYACAVFLNVALGFMLLGLLDSRVPRWVCGLVFVGLFGAQVTTYWQGYRTGQNFVIKGGYPFSDVVRDLTPKGSVIVVAGADWAPMTPLYSERKALMIRNGLEYDGAYLNRAFADLADEDVSAVVLYGPLKTNRAFIDLAAAKFDLDTSAPTFFHPMADVYVRKIYIKGVQMRLKGSLKYPDIKIPAKAEEGNPAGVFHIAPAVARTAFANVTPGPYQALFAFGLDLVEHEGKTALSAHPDSDLWLRAPAGATRINWDFGIFPPAYEKAGDKTNGVEFIIEGETPDGQRRRIYRRLLDPVRDASDRGEQHEDIPYTPLPGETLQFSSRSNGNYAFDWTYWVRIEVK